MTHESRVLALVHPPHPGQRGGNRVTALRWAKHLRSLGWRVFQESSWSGRPCAGLVALHATKSADSIRRFRNERPDAPIVVGLAGTDVYGEDGPDERALGSARVATRIVALQELALAELPADLRRRGRVIHQSVPSLTCEGGRAEDAFDVVVVAHLRAVKDPLLAARAARRLPEPSRVRVTLVGGALDDELAAEAEREARENARFRWRGPLSRTDTLEAIARAHVLVSSSRHEGGANVVTEALAQGTPVLATGIPGSLGILGTDFPGVFPVGDEVALAALLERAESDSAFRSELESASRARAWVADPERERAAWSALLDELFG